MMDRRKVDVLCVEPSEREGDWSRFHGHVREGNKGGEKVLGRYGVKERTDVVNTSIKKMLEHRITCKSVSKLHTGGLHPLQKVQFERYGRM